MALVDSPVDYWWFLHYDPDGRSQAHKDFVDEDSCTAYVRDYMRAYANEATNPRSVIRSINRHLDRGELVSAADLIYQSFNEKMEWSRSFLKHYTSDNTLEVMNDSRR